VASPELGSWAPLPLAEVVSRMRHFPALWWISGGIALDLFAGTPWRAHDDIDIGVRRQDIPLLRRHLVDWDLQVASDGALTPWDGRHLAAERNENNVWARRDPTGPWELDVTISQGDTRHWIFRRDPSFIVGWSDALLVRPSIPFLAPELQLLFKSRDVRPKDLVDAEVVIPLLDAAAAATLRERLSSHHPWQELLR
jgi:hypothetical protein